MAAKRPKITHERRHIRLRLELLDELLASPLRRNYNELLEALSKALELKGEIPIQLRMLKNDISFLENNMGAPIHRPTKKERAVYYYEKFSLKEVPIDDDDVSIMKRAVAILKKATNIKLTGEIDEMIARLENKINTNVPESHTMIAFEEHTEALGMNHFDDLFAAIQHKSTLKIQYKPFGKDVREWIIHPYMLKQYRSRWFLICRINQSNFLSNIRLDSIEGKIKNSSEPFIENDLFDPETYFKNVIGVTVPRDEEPLKIIIKIAPSSAEYVRTKPIQKDQKILKVYKDGSMKVELNLYNNYELKSLLLSMGPAIEVLEPDVLRKELKELYQQGTNLYK
ncbi:MAG: WYL domain-containing protein [Flavobacterium sp.]|nr:MAG: WYL domain-containing protein [Flavobacterium sp.]